MSEPTSFPPEPGAPPSSVERRKSVRYAANRFIAGYLITDDNRIIWTRALHDISASGIGLIVDRRIDPGALLTLDLYLPRRLPRLCQVRVMHTLDDATGTFLIGGTFAQELAEDEVAELL